MFTSFVLSVIELSPIVLVPVNFGTTLVVPVPVTGLVKAFCLLLNVLQSVLLSNPVCIALAIVEGTVTVLVLIAVMCPSAEDVTLSTTLNDPPKDGVCVDVVSVLDTAACVRVIVLLVAWLALNVPDPDSTPVA